MKKVFFLLSLVVVTGSIFAQKKTTTSATVKFDASTSIDDLPKAENKTVIAAINTSTGDVAFEAAVKNFSFSNPSIQDHFNGEKWLNSQKFPSFIYKGKLTDFPANNFSKDGTYKAKTAGTLTVKGVSRNIEVPVTVIVKGETLTVLSNFSITLSDYGITGGSIDGGKVAKEPKITVSADLK
jgi:polyisoprenoid-binding protein YceI